MLVTVDRKVLVALPALHRGDATVEVDRDFLPGIESV
jgi:hypothetical protein